MKKTTWPNALFVAVMILPQVAWSQVPREGVIPVVCTDKEEMGDMLDRHGERAMMTMITYREISGRVAEVPTVLFANPETQSWTLVERPQPDVYCAVGWGDNIRPYQR